MIEQFEIPLPSLGEQLRIVAKVDKLMTLVDVLETQLATARATGLALVEAAVAEVTFTRMPHFERSDRSALEA